MKQKTLAYSLSILLFDKHKDLVKLFLYKLDEKSLGKISFERKDLEQELNIRLYLAIKAFIKKYFNEQEDGFGNIRNFLFISLKNSTTGFLKKIIKVQDLKFIDLFDFEDDINLSYEDKQQMAKISKTSCMFEGINVFQFLNNKERKIFRMYLNGYKAKEISKKYKLKTSTAMNIISVAKFKIKKGINNENKESVSS